MDALLGAPHATDDKAAVQTQLHGLDRVEHPHLQPGAAGHGQASRINAHLDVVVRHLVGQAVLVAVRKSQGRPMCARRVDNERSPVITVDERDIFRLAGEAQIGEPAVAACVDLCEKVVERGQQDSRRRRPTRFQRLQRKRSPDLLLEDRLRTPERVRGRRALAQ